MNNQLTPIVKDLARSVLMPFKILGVSIAAVAVMTLHVIAASPSATTSSLTDAAGDTVFPFDLYNGPAPPWIDLVQASVALTRGVFHFEIKVNAEIPANGDPGFSPPVNHLGSTFGIQTDRKTAEHFNFFGQQRSYYFNFLVGAVYVAGDSGIGLAPGWRGFMLGTNGFIEIPLVIRRDTYIFETSAASLGNPASFNWVVASECDPVPVPVEANKSLLIVDYAPDDGYATWPALQP